MFSAPTLLTLSIPFFQGDRDLQIACARDLLAILSGGVDAEAVAPPRADALRSCIRPLVGKLPMKYLAGTQDSSSSKAQNISQFDLEFGRREQSADFPELLKDRTEWHADSEGALPLPVTVHRSTVRKLVKDLLDTELKEVKRKRKSANIRRSRLGLKVGQESRLEARFRAFIAQPPAEVMALVKAVDAQRGNGSALRRALSPSHFEVRIVNLSM